MSNIADAVFAALLLAVFAIFAVIGLSIFNSISATGVLGSYAGQFADFYKALNNMALFVAIGISLAAVFSGLMIRTHPAFFFISVVLVFLEFMIVPNFVNIYNQVAQSMSPEVQNSMASQSQILQILPVITALGTLLTVVVGIVRE